MSADHEDRESQAQRVLEELADSLLDATREELAEEAEELDEDLETSGAEVRSVLLRAVNLHKKSLLEKARESYEEKMSVLSSKRRRLPTSAQRQRELLRSLLVFRPSLDVAVTAHFREGEAKTIDALSDDAVASLLVDLDDLGVVEEFRSATESDDDEE